jgi:hypothetical protein
MTITLPAELPIPILDTRWLGIGDWHSSWVPIISKEFDRVVKNSGWNPKVIKLVGSLFMIDVSAHRGKTFSYPSYIKVVEFVDHPFLNQLPVGVPRVVRSLYTKEVMLANLRANDGWSFAFQFRLAEEKWSEYLKNVKPSWSN